MSTPSVPGEVPWTAALDVRLVRRLFARRPVPPPPVRRAADRLALAGQRLPVSTRLARRAAPLGDGGPQPGRPVVHATPLDGASTRAPAPVAHPRTDSPRVPVPGNEVLRGGPGRRVPAIPVGAARPRGEGPSQPAAGTAPAQVRSARPAVPGVSRVARAGDGAVPGGRGAPDFGRPPAPAVAVAQVRPLRPVAATPRAEGPRPLPEEAAASRWPVVLPRHEVLPPRPEVSPRHEAAPAGPGPRATVPASAPRTGAPGRTLAALPQRTRGATPAAAPAVAATAGPAPAAAAPAGPAPVQRLPDAARSGGSRTEQPPSPEELVELVLHRLGRELAVSAERRGLRPGEPGGGGLGG